MGSRTMITPAPAGEGSGGEVVTPDHHAVVRRAFAHQAAHFAEAGLTLSNADHLQWMVTHLDPQAGADVLDVAAGTVHLGRALAPHVRRMVALDATPEMLREGLAHAAGDGIGNVRFVLGAAERLPHRDGAFDMVVSRFALHHFPAPAEGLREMTRVCRSGGRVTVVDLLAPDDPGLAPGYNRLERLRDPSHVAALTLQALADLMHACDLAVTHNVVRDVVVNAQRWMDLTSADPAAREAITSELAAEVEGGPATGLRPFVREGSLMFLHRYGVLVGVKP